MRRRANNAHKLVAIGISFTFLVELGKCFFFFIVFLFFQKHSKAPYARQADKKKINSMILYQRTRELAFAF